MTVFLSHWKHYGVCCEQDSTLHVREHRSRDTLYCPAEGGGHGERWPVLPLFPHPRDPRVSVTQASRGLDGCTWTQKSWHVNYKLWHSYKSWTLSLETHVLMKYNWGILFLAETDRQSKDPDSLCMGVFYASVYTTEMQVGFLHQILEGTYIYVYICMENFLLICLLFYK